MIVLILLQNIKINCNAINATKNKISEQFGEIQIGV